MNFARRIATLCILLSFFTFSNASAQLWRYLNYDAKSHENDQKQDAYYTITSVEGVPCKVRVVRKVLVDGVTRIKSTTDSLGIESTMGIDTVFFLNKNLMEIIYSPHGGSNDGYENTLILSISKGKFCIVMEVMSQHVFGGGGPEGFYDLNVKLTGRTVADLKMEVNVHEVDSSTYKGAKHHNRHNRFVLRYHPNLHVFYNEIRHIDGLTTFLDNRTYTAKLKRLSGDYPTIIMGEYEYYFIDGTWYQGSKDRSTAMYGFGAYCERLVPNLYPRDN